MSEEIIFIVEESEDGGYEAKALSFSIYTTKYVSSVEERNTIHFLKPIKEIFR